MSRRRAADFQRVRSSDLNVSRLSDSASEAVRLLGSKEILNGILIKDIVMGNGETRDIAHKLGRKPRGWIVVDTDSVGTIRRTGEYTSTYITITTTGTPTFSLWVF